MTGIDMIQLRQKLGVSHAQLGRLLGLSTASIVRAEAQKLLRLKPLPTVILNVLRDVAQADGVIKTRECVLLADTDLRAALVQLFSLQERWR